MWRFAACIRHIAEYELDLSAWIVGFSPGLVVITVVVSIWRSVYLCVLVLQEEARRHFNCPILEGMELENQGGTGTELNHWEKRLLEVNTLPLCDFGCEQAGFLLVFIIFCSSLRTRPWQAPTRRTGCFLGWRWPSWRTAAGTEPTTAWLRGWTGAAASAATSSWRAASSGWTDRDRGHNNTLNVPHDHKENPL